jgi:hypothetical protein
VTEETTSPIVTAGPAISEDPKETGKEAQGEDLMEVATPQISNKENEGFPKIEKNEKNEKEDKDKAEKEKSDTDSVIDSEVLGEMKNVAI